MATSKTHAEAKDRAAPAPIIHKQRETPQKVAGLSLAGQTTTSEMPPPNGKSSAARAADLMTAPAAASGAASWARLMRAMQGTVGNTRLSRMLGTAVQTKLTVGAPNDRYEQEADHTADKVMRMPGPPVTKQAEALPSGSRPLQRQRVDGEKTAAGQTAMARQQMEEVERAPIQTPTVQRQIAEEEGRTLSPRSIRRQAIEKEAPEIGQMPGVQRQMEDKEAAGTQLPTAQRQRDKEEESTAATLPMAQRQMVEEEESATPVPPVQRQTNDDTEMVQAEAMPGQTPKVTSDVESYINASRGGGEPLSESARAFAEPRFGQDFSGVRVHTDMQAAGATRTLNAQAFTSGHDIYFFLF